MSTSNALAKVPTDKADRPAPTDAKVAVEFAGAPPWIGSKSPTRLEEPGLRRAAPELDAPEGAAQIDTFNTHMDSILA